MYDSAGPDVTVPLTILGEIMRYKLILALMIFMPARVLAATTDATHALGLQPGEIHWTPGEASDTAWPVGDRQKPGSCLELIRWHAGHFSRPHYHSKARFAVVMDGTWWVSTSDIYDPNTNTVPYPKGSVLTDLPGGVHYDGAKPETGDALVAIFMDCPLDGTSAERK